MDVSGRSGNTLKVPRSRPGRPTTGPPQDPERSRSWITTVAKLTSWKDIHSPPSPLSELTCQRQRERRLTRLKVGDTRLRSQIRLVGPNDGSLFDDCSILAIRTDIETEGDISGESFSVHPCQHWALSVDVVVNLNG